MDAAKPKRIEWSKSVYDSFVLLKVTPFLMDNRTTNARASHKAAVEETNEIDPSWTRTIINEGNSIKIYTTVSVRDLERIGDIRVQESYHNQDFIHP